MRYYVTKLNIIVILLFQTSNPKCRNFVCIRMKHFLILILVINQLAQNLFYNKFISCLYMLRAPCAHRQEVKIVLYSHWYHHTETTEWSKITKITKITNIQFYKYEHKVVKLMCECFRCDCCVLLTINML